MKNLLFILFLSLVISCNNVESNSPALQADINNVLFKANFVGGDYFTDGNYFILQGKADDEIVTLRAKYPPANVLLEFGGESENFATFESANGIIYSTILDGGSGSMIINNNNTLNKTVTGDFNFTAVSIAQDTIRVSGGIFFKAPYGNAIDELPSAGVFYADVDGNPFVSINVFANDSGSSIIIQGIVNSKKIKITIPNNVEVGTYDLPTNGFSALCSWF